MSADELHIDYETKSEANLKKVGLSRYSRDYSTELLMGAYNVNGGKVRQWDSAQGERMPCEVREALEDPHVIKWAWNAAFEIAITTNVLGIETPIHSWRCAMVLAMSLSLPGKLERAGPAIGLSEDKQKMREGGNLVRYFTIPRKPTKTKNYRWNTFKTDPVKWDKFLQYNRQDVLAEQEITNRLIDWNLPEHEWEMWHIDQHINMAGIPVNIDYCENALRITDYLRKERLEVMDDLTGLDNPESGDQLLPWLQDYGYPFNDLKKGHIKRALEDWRPGDSKKLRRALQIRAELSKSSVKKYEAYLNLTDDDGRYRYALQFGGAGRTLRWAGRGVQVQNLARPAPWLEKSQETVADHIERYGPKQFELIYGEPFDALSTGVRPAIQAPEGFVFADADLNAIENRVLGWMAWDERILSVFKNNRDPYVDFAQYMFEETYENLFKEFKAGDKKRRNLAKPPVLGCGYMLSAGTEYEDEKTGEIMATGLLGYAWNMGVKMTLEESKLAVDTWRDTFTDAVAFWKGIDKAARHTLRTGERSRFEVIEFDIDGPFMRMRLPSKRYIHYYKPKIERRRAPWGEMRPTITYMGQNDKNQWVRISTHPGKLTENADQAIARDLLAHGIRNAVRAGLDVRLHVHDQIAALVEEDKAEAKLKKLIECMTDNPKWAKDLPLAAAGTLTKVFIKD